MKEGGRGSRRKRRMEESGGHEEETSFDMSLYIIVIYLSICLSILSICLHAHTYMYTSYL